MLMELLAVVQLNAVGQVLACIVGLILMVGSALFYHSDTEEKVEGFLIFMIFSAGFTLCLWGIGGNELVQQMGF